LAENNYYQGTGRRKESTAQVRLYRGEGKFTVDGKSYEERFSRPEYQRSILEAFLITDTLGKYDVEAKVSGGGVSGQCDAIRLGIARALVKLDESFRPLLRKSGLLTRDPRAKERKKPGLRRARKAPQYTKR
jgi:small subunit ribosomal protein S9